MTWWAYFDVPTLLRDVETKGSSRPPPKCQVLVKKKHHPPLVSPNTTLREPEMKKERLASYCDIMTSVCRPPGHLSMPSGMQLLAIEHFGHICIWGAG